MKSMYVVADILHDLSLKNEIKNSSLQAHAVLRKPTGKLIS